MIIANFPSNPTTRCVDINFLTELVRIAKKYNIYLVHDIAYADIVFDDYKAPSILQVDGAKDTAVEFYTLSKSYNRPGGRIGFMCGNKKVVNALSRIKSYLDYGKEKKRKGGEREEGESDGRGERRGENH